MLLRIGYNGPAIKGVYVGLSMEAVSRNV